jgi:hypothetical protein
VDGVEVGCGAYDRVEAGEGSTDGETGETRLGDGRVDDSLLAEAVEQALGDLVAESGGLAGARRCGQQEVDSRSVVLGNLLTQNKDLVVSLHLLGHGLVQGLSDGHLLDAALGSIVPRDSDGTETESGTGNGC